MMTHKKEEAGAELGHTQEGTKNISYNFGYEILVVFHFGPCLVSLSWSNKIHSTPIIIPPMVFILGNPVRPSVATNKQ